MVVIMVGAMVPVVMGLVVYVMGRVMKRVTALIARWRSCWWCWRR